MLGFLLNIIATIAIWILRRFAWCYGLFFSGNNNKYNRDIALAKDQYANVLCGPLLNKLLITPDGYKFGNPKEKISGVIGKNFLKDTLTNEGFSNGLFWYNFLEKRERNHCIKAIDNNI